ncbi:hypothetical protein, partial [Marinilactibacillus psychrotolerans]
IKEANKNNMYILVSNMRQAEEMFQQSRKMNTPILYPITVNEWENGKVAWRVKRQGILVDEAKIILEELLETSVHMMSVSKEDDES